MRTYCAAILVVMIALAAPSLAHAQYASWLLDRDYTLSTPGGKFGFQVYRHYPNNDRRNVVAVGDLGQIPLNRVTIAVGVAGLALAVAAANRASAFRRGAKQRIAPAS